MSGIARLLVAVCLSEVIKCESKNKPRGMPTGSPIRTEVDFAWMLGL